MSETIRVDLHYLDVRERRTIAAGYNCPQFIKFCRTMIERGYIVVMREPTVSKYINVCNGSKKFTVRYSNHGAKQLPNDPCDFFVGKNRFGTTNTEQAIEATIATLGEPNE